ncbi:hypothetical protein GCM10009665_30910 [Kitasatospora nipponensis]|uniref:Endolytic murein transglycosylase n=2 Tax=Kitasatospora nipponensis TaxID=258049 RepID=A0ABN1WA68_9ACTN
MQQQVPQQPMPQQYAPAPQPAPAAPAPAQPSGPGPDGIDWEAEAAALDNPQPGAEMYDADLYADDEYAEGEYAEGEYVEEEHPEGDLAQDELAEEAEQHDSFFDAGQDISDEAEAKRKAKGKKSGLRNSGACLVVTLVLLGGMGGAGWWGYGFYKSHFGPPADYAGATAATGTTAVTIEIKDGATGSDMGTVLKDADVVKSTDAFIAAYGKNPKGNTIQPGTYTMKHQMSAAAAVQLLVDSNGGNALIIPEGIRAFEIYAKIDTKLKLKAGTTAAVAKSQANNLDLPAYAQGNLEGFLFPQKYSITDGMKPEDLLKQMVDTAVQHYQQLNLDQGAQKIGLKSGYEVLVEASILQREGNNDNDFGKIARVLSNRLNTNATQGKLQLDTTLQYELGRTNFTDAERNGKTPYNTYQIKGLPPTPISNPGDAAIEAVLAPTPGDWVYFVAVSPTETRFSNTFAAFKNDVKDYCTAHGQGFDDQQGTCKT